jgi:hypothetical protein
MEFNIYKLENPTSKYFYYYLSKHDEKRAKRNIKQLHKSENSNLFIKLLDDMKNNKAIFKVIYSNSNEESVCFLNFKLFNTNLYNRYCLNYYKQRNYNNNSIFSLLLDKPNPLYVHNIDELYELNEKVQIFRCQDLNNIDELYELNEKVQIFRCHDFNNEDINKICKIVETLLTN